MREGREMQFGRVPQRVLRWWGTESGTAAGSRFRKRAAGRIVRVTLFFFQAEDGIRDRNVTGVQTCALPILAQGNWIIMFPEGTRTPRGRQGTYKHGGTRLAVETGTPVLPIAVTSARCWPRSEERRVGKECRSRWAPER